MAVSCDILVANVHVLHHLVNDKYRVHLAEFWVQLDKDYALFFIGNNTLTLVSIENKSRFYFFFASFSYVSRDNYTFYCLSFFYMASATKSSYCSSIYCKHKGNYYLSEEIIRVFKGLFLLVLVACQQPSFADLLVLHWDRFVVLALGKFYITTSFGRFEILLNCNFFYLHFIIIENE